MGSSSSAEAQREDVKEAVRPSYPSRREGTPASGLSLKSDGSKRHIIDFKEGQPSSLRRSAETLCKGIKGEKKKKKKKKKKDHPSDIQPGARRWRSAETLCEDVKGEKKKKKDHPSTIQPGARRWRSAKKDSNETISRFLWSWMLAVTLFEANKETISPLDLRPGTPDSGLSFKSDGSKNYTIDFKEGQPSSLWRPAEALCEDMKEEVHPSDIQDAARRTRPGTPDSGVSTESDDLIDDFSDSEDGQSCFWRRSAGILCQVTKEGEEDHTFDIQDEDWRPGTPDSGLSFKSDSSKNFTIQFNEQLYPPTGTDQGPDS